MGDGGELAEGTHSPVRRCRALGEMGVKERERERREPSPPPAVMANTSEEES